MDGRWEGVLTKEGGVSCHVGALEHLCEAAKGTDYAFDDLECRLCALAEAVCEAIRVVGVHSHPSSHSTHTVAAHSSHPAVAAHSTHSISAHPTTIH